MGETDTDNPPKEATKSFLGHLVDLRNTIIYIGLSLLGGVLATAPFAPDILALLKAPLAASDRDPATFLKALDLTSGFSIAMRVSFWSGLIISFPLISFFIGRFIMPGLTPRERRAVRGGLGFAIMLFIVGVLMGYHFTLPVGIRMMLRVSDWMEVTPEFIEIGRYVSFTLKLLLAFGLAFELPVVVLALGLAGIVDSVQLREKRRHVAVGLMVLAAILTPSDPYTMLFMAAPLVLLYEACIWILWYREKRA